MINKERLVAGGIGFVAGILWLLVMRALLAYPAAVHYHANFGVYINGERQAFSDFGYYEEVQACLEDGSVNPRARVHMHQPNNDVVHVHASGATWGNFFENIGWAISDSALIAENSVYIDGADGTLSYFINGQPAQRVAEKVIESEDILLISFGTNDVHAAQLASIASTAGSFNETPDPAACSGGSESGLWGRFVHALRG